MIIDLKRLFKDRDAKMDIDYSFSIEKVDIDGFYPFVSPVSAKGKLKNYAGSVELTVDLSYDFYMPCSRCMEETLTKQNLKVHHALVRENCEDMEDFYLTVEDSVDMDELLYQDIILNLPVKYICKDDCRGICSSCGANLNKENCSCEKGEVQNAFSSLKALLED